MNGDAERRDRSRTPSPLSRSSSRSSIGHSPGRTTLLKRNQSLNAKQVRFYRNGDKYFVGLKLAVSSERYKEFFPLLVELSNKLDLSTGAVRFVFDAESGQQVTDISQMNSNSSYVCSSVNSFKELEGGYGQTQPKSWSVGSTKGKDRSELKNWGKSSPRMGARREFIKPKLVTVVKNGKPPQKKVTMLLNKKTAVDLNQVLDHLSSKGTLGKVDRLCCLDGREIKELRDLFNEDMIFIAFSSKERFPEEGFDVDVQSPKKTWKSTIKPTRTPYMPSLRNELDLPWKQLPRARCLACALRALTTGLTPPPPQSHQRPRPKSAGPRLSSHGLKVQRSEAWPSSADARYLQPRPSTSPRHSPADVNDGPESSVKSSNKTPRIRSSYPKTSTPRPSTAKKSLSFSADTPRPSTGRKSLSFFSAAKVEETTDSAPKPKGIRGGGRRRKAQLALAHSDELDPNDPQHAYYILIHEELKAGKPTASVKPIMSGGPDHAVCSPENGADNNVTSAANEVVVNDITEEKREIVQVCRGSKMIEKVTYLIKESCDVPDEEKPAPVQHNTNGSSPVLNEEKPTLVNHNVNQDSSPVIVSEEKQVEYWAKPKPIRGRKQKPAKSDVNGNEQNNPTEKAEEVAGKHDVAVNGRDEQQPTRSVLTNGYRITPYRDLKRGSGVKRSSSLRSPRPRRNTLESNGSGAGVRGRSVSPSPRANGQGQKTPRAKLNGTKKISNGGSYTSGEELYPAAVFQRENSDSARKARISRTAKAVRGKKNATKKRRKQSSSDKFYSTVWLSDYESWDMKSETGDPNTCQSSRATTPFSSRPTTPLDSRRSSPISSPPSSPFVGRESLNGNEEFDSGNPSDADFIHKPKAVKLTRTMSLPESELCQIEAKDLQQRFTTLQLEQENKELKQLTDDLQSALGSLEKRVHAVNESDGENVADKPRRKARSLCAHSNGDVVDEKYLNELAFPEPSTPSSLSSNDTFVQNPKLSKPNSLDLSGAPRKRKHPAQGHPLDGKSTKATKHKHDSMCCITS